MNEDDLPRYTWNWDGHCYQIMRRTGLYGQEVVTKLWPPAETIRDALHKEIASAVCEYLDRRDRERDDHIMGRIR